MYYPVPSEIEAGRGEDERALLGEDALRGRIGRLAPPGVNADAFTDHVRFGPVYGVGVRSLERTQQPSAHGVSSGRVFMSRISR